MGYGLAINANVKQWKEVCLFVSDTLSERVRLVLLIAQFLEEIVFH